MPLDPVAADYLEMVAQANLPTPDGSPESIRELQVRRGAARPTNVRRNSSGSQVGGMERRGAGDGIEAGVGVVAELTGGRGVGRLKRLAAASPPAAAPGARRT